MKYLILLLFLIGCKETVLPKDGYSCFNYKECIKFKVIKAEKRYDKNGYQIKTTDKHTNECEKFHNEKRCFYVREGIYQGLKKSKK